MALPRRLVVTLLAIGAAACSRAPAPAPKAPTRIALPVAAEPPTVDAPPEEHWYFEQLSPDGKRALLRRIDPNAHSPFDARVVEVDTGATVESAALEELGNLPASTVGHPDQDELDAKLAAPELGGDLVRGAKLSSAFPFGACGRFSAAPTAIAFNAGDWVYVADARGHVKKRVADVAAYDPRFTPDGKHLFFRRAAGKLDGVLAKYELFVVPSDLSSAPRALAGTAGALGAVVVAPDKKSAIVLASREPQIKTCALSVGLRPPFAVKKLACLDGGERLVEFVVSPKGRWLAAITQKRNADGDGLSWRLRVVSLVHGKVLLDEPALAGQSLRAISDEGMLVESALSGALLIDAASKAKTSREIRELDLGYRAFFRSATELVFVRGGSVGVLDLATRGS